MSDDFWDGPDWQDWMIIGPMTEDIANEELEREQARKDTFEENEQESEDPFTNMNDENIDTNFDCDPETDC
jgi:hypothetical protein